VVLIGCECGRSIIKLAELSDNICVRKAQETDLAAILRLLADDTLGRHREDAFVDQHGGLHDDYLNAFNSVNSDPNQYLAVFEQGDEIIGCLQLSFIPGLSRRGALRGQIEGVRVAANFRGKGYGTKMLRWAIETCREQGCKLVQLTSDKTRQDAQRFYKDLGFVQSHEGFKLEI